MEWKGLVRLPPAEQHRGLPIPIADDLASRFVPHKNLPPTHIYHQDKVSHDCSISGFLAPCVSYCSILLKKRHKGVVTFLTCKTFTPLHPLILLYLMHTTQLAHQLRPCYGGLVGWGTLIAQSSALIFTFASMGVCIM